MEEGLCWDEEGSGAHPEQRDQLQEPEAGSTHRDNTGEIKKIIHFFINLLQLCNVSKKLHIALDDLCCQQVPASMSGMSP